MGFGSEGFGGGKQGQQLDQRTTFLHQQMSDEQRNTRLCEFCGSSVHAWQGNCPNCGAAQFIAQAAAKENPA